MIGYLANMLLAMTFGSFLTADKDLDVFGLVLLAICVYIDSDDFAAVAKIRFPHGERSSAHHADFDHHRVLTSKSFKMALIYVKIMDPLVYTLVAIIQKIAMQKSVAVHFFHPLL